MTYAAKLELLRVYKFERGCARCPERDPVCLDLHHRDPATKHWRLRKGTSLSNLGAEELMAELLKCEVLCANCHRKEHAAKHARKTVIEGAKAPLSGVKGQDSELKAVD